MVSSVMGIIKVGQLPHRQIRHKKENYALCYTVAEGDAQTRIGDLTVQRAAQTNLGAWLKRHRPTHRCRVQRLSPQTFAIWVEKKATKSRE